MENWKPVPEFPDHYEVSDLGRCRRIKAGRGARLGLRTPCRSGAGYWKLALSVDNRIYQRLIHRLVWQAFNGPIPDELQVNHLNGDKADNALSNLQLVTPSENIEHSYRVLKRPPIDNRGEKSGKSKLTDENVREIRRLRAQGMIQREIAEVVGVTRSCVKHVLDGRTWGHV